MHIFPYKSTSNDETEHTIVKSLSRQSKWTYHMALVLSQSKGTRLNSNPKSLKVAIIQNNWEQQVAATTYTASMVD